MWASNGPTSPPTPGRRPDLHCWTRSANSGSRAKGRVRTAQEKEGRLETATGTWRGAGGEAKDREWGRGGGREAVRDTGPTGLQALGQQERERGGPRPPQTEAAPRCSAPLPTVCPQEAPRPPTNQPYSPQSSGSSAQVLGGLSTVSAVGSRSFKIYPPRHRGPEVLATATVAGSGARAAGRGDPLKTPNLTSKWASRCAPRTFSQMLYFLVSEPGAADFLPVSASRTGTSGHLFGQSP